MIGLDGIIFSIQNQGGISVYFHQLVKQLQLQSIDYRLLLEDPLMQEFQSNPNSIHRNARILERYRDCRVNKNIKVFHSSYYRLPNTKKVPTVVTVHDFIYERYQHGPKRWVHSFQKNAAIRSAQAVICISESTKRDLLEFVGETSGQTIHVIYNGVSDVFKTLNLQQKIRPFVLFVGQRNGYKNFKQLLLAMSYLPDLEIHCVGGGAIDTKEFNGVSNSIIKRIRHHGYVTDEQLNVLYNTAVCLVYPSAYEGFGIPVVEAMRAGCPVVSSDCKAVLEVGREALTSVPLGDSRAMADGILRTMSGERSNLIEMGASIAQDYSWEATHIKTLEVYRTLINKLDVEK